MNQEEKYQNDYFNYLCEPENASRYQLLLDQIRQFSPVKPIRLFDIGCGNGALAKYVDSEFLYHGFDHNPLAIASAKSKPWSNNNSQFEVSNILQWAHQTTEADQKADVLVFSSILGGVRLSTKQENILIPPQEQDLILNCIENHLKPHGLISVVTTFRYDPNDPGSLFSFATTNRKQLNGRLPLFKLSTLTETILPMPDLNKAVKRQKNKPRWFHSPRLYTDNDQGDYIAHEVCTDKEVCMGVWCSLFKRKDI